MKKVMGKVCIGLLIIVLAHGAAVPDQGMDRDNQNGNYHHYRR